MMLLPDDDDDEDDDEEEEEDDEDDEEVWLDKLFSELGLDFNIFLGTGRTSNNPTSRYNG